MRLLKLSSTNTNFRTLKFNPGLNIVSGLQLSQEEKKTINGIGKSLSLKLIHHIFGATFQSDEEKKLESFLKTYGEFQLDFIHKKKTYSIKKDFSKFDFFINNKKIVKTNYPNELKKIFLGAESKINFKSLLNVFARRYGGTYYSNALTQQDRPRQDYFQKHINLYLLDIDISLVEKKKFIKEEISKLDKAMEVEKEFKKYRETINQSDEKDLKDFKDQVVKYKKKKKEFVIAENYNPPDPLYSVDKDDEFIWMR